MVYVQYTQYTPSQWHSVNINSDIFLNSDSGSGDRVSNNLLTIRQQSNKVQLNCKSHYNIQSASKLKLNEVPGIRRQKLTRYFLWIALRWPLISLSGMLWSFFYQKKFFSIQ